MKPSHFLPSDSSELGSKSYRVCPSEVEEGGCLRVVDYFLLEARLDDGVAPSVDSFLPTGPDFFEEDRCMLLAVAQPFVKREFAVVVGVGGTLAVRLHGQSVVHQGVGQQAMLQLL